MTENLYEAIVGNGISPNYFWLVLDIPDRDTANDERAEKILSDLETGTLHGIKGISDSKEILTNWWMMCRNAALMLDARSVIEMNDIEKIQYHDPDHLMNNNMALIYRLFDKKTDKWGRDQLMLNVMQYTLSALKKINPAVANDMEYYGAARVMCDKWRDDPANVNTVEQLADVMLDTLKNDRNTQYGAKDTSINDIEAAVRAAVLHIGRVYEDEQEWVVHSESFKVPARTVMLVGVDMGIAQQYQDWLSASEEERDKIGSFFSIRKWAFERYHRLMQVIEKHHLRQRYTLRFIDSEKFENMRSVVTGRRRERAARSKE